MKQTTNTPVTAVERIGGEMLAWTDRDPAKGLPIARGAALTCLLGELLDGSGGRRVLVAGPHHEEVVSALLDRGAEVTWLWRSDSDAAWAFERFPTVTVCCGGVIDLPPAGQFDLVLAVDGVARLDSAESAQHDAAAALAVLVGALRPGGLLALAQDNPFGVHRLVELPLGRHYTSNATWCPSYADDDLRPVSLAHLDRRLADHGMTVAAGYALYPTSRTPTVFIGRELLGDTSSPLRGHLGAALSHALTEAYRGMALLTDPRPLVATALRVGAEGALAPGWLMIARRNSTAPGGAAVPRHDLVVAESGDGGAYELSAPAGQPRLDVLVSPPDEQVVRAGMRRVRLTGGRRVSGGQIFEERLLRHCARADLVALRADVNRFVRWLDRHAVDGLVSGPAAVAAPCTVLADGDGFCPWPVGWQPVTPVPATIVVVRAMLRFASRLVTGGHPHPWPLISSVVDLTTVLLATVGRTATDDEFRAAVDLQVTLDAAEFNLSLSERRNRRLALLAAQPGAPCPDVAGYRELAEANWRQRYLISHLLAKMDWTEEIIRSRDHWHSQMDWEIQFYRRTWVGRFLMLSRAAYRTVSRGPYRRLRRATARTVRAVLRRPGRRPAVSGSPGRAPSR